jgi:hypothetical protein
MQVSLLYFSSYHYDMNKPRSLVRLINRETCRVRNFKERTKKQSKKDEIRWRILVKNILKTKSIGGSPFFSSAFSMSS